MSLSQLFLKETKCKVTVQWWKVLRASSTRGRNYHFRFPFQAIYIRAELFIEATSRCNAISLGWISEAVAIACTCRHVRFICSPPKAIERVYVFEASALK